MLYRSIENPTSGRVFVMSYNPTNRPVPVNRILKDRNESVFGTKSYRDGLQRAFNVARIKVFLNPDMIYFVTLTYKGKDHDINDVMQDVKSFIKTEIRIHGVGLKYIWVAEYQKRGSIHVHMITNGQFTTYTNRNGYKSLKYWTKGFSSVLSVENFDDNFRSYLYLFKYLRKSERIGKSYVHASRNISLSQYVSDRFNPADINKYNVMDQDLSEVSTDQFHQTFNYYFLSK